MRNLTNHPAETITLTGNEIDKTQQILDAARQQVRTAWAETDEVRMEDALTEAEEAVDTARASVAQGLEAVQDDREASGEAEGEREKWRPNYHPA